MIRGHQYFASVSLLDCTEGMCVDVRHRQLRAYFWIRHVSVRDLLCFIVSWCGSLLRIWVLPLCRSILPRQLSWDFLPTPPFTSHPLLCVPSLLFAWLLWIVLFLCFAAPLLVLSLRSHRPSVVSCFEASSPLIATWASSAEFVCDSRFATAAP